MVGYLVISFSRNPTPRKDETVPSIWRPVESEELEYYDIKNGEEATMDKGLFLERAKFWRSLPINSRRVRVKTEL